MSVPTSDSVDASTKESLGFKNVHDSPVLSPTERVLMRLPDVSQSNLKPELHFHLRDQSSLQSKGYSSIRTLMLSQANQSKT